MGNIQLPRDQPVLGVLGGGQLGRMTALAALRMGVEVEFLVPEESAPVRGVGKVQVADWTDSSVLREFAARCSVVTAESEWAPVDLLARVLPGDVGLWPSPQTITTVRDKGVQKTVLKRSGLPVPDFRRCSSMDEAEAAASSFGYPVLAKKFRGSYDGYGNDTVHSEAQLRTAWADLADQDGLMIEQFVDFRRELAVLVARNVRRDKVVYPVACTIQKDHRCHMVTVPSGAGEDIETEARRIAEAATEAVDGVGIICVELFELADGRVQINELAPRPHNTGHYTIDASHTSQFENHIRAVFGWPLGNPGLSVPSAVMVNVLGSRTGRPAYASVPEAMQEPDVTIHLYGKDLVQRNRKMGHVTITGNDTAVLQCRAERAASLINL